MLHESTFADVCRRKVTIGRGQRKFGRIRRAMGHAFPSYLPYTRVYQLNRLYEFTVTEKELYLLYFRASCFSLFHLRCTLFTIEVVGEYTCILTTSPTSLCACTSGQKSLYDMGRDYSQTF